MANVYGEVMDTASDKMAERLVKILEGNRIRTVIMLRNSTSGPVYSVAVSMNDLERAKMIARDITEDISIQSGQFYNWYRD